MKSKTFEDVEVWRRAHQFVLKIYRLKREFSEAQIIRLGGAVQTRGDFDSGNLPKVLKKRV